MNTLFLLLAQYDGRAVVPVDAVCKDYLSHLTLPKFLRKVSSGDIDLPLVRSPCCDLRAALPRGDREDCTKAVG